MNGDVAGSGELDARHVDALRASLSLSGSGRVLATVEQTVDLSLTGSGAIDWCGNATIRSVSTDGSGSISHH